MNRMIYRMLLRLHPSNFREQHGDEMLCIFDESAPEEMWRLIADALQSAMRQWLFHSGWWKFVAGAAISGMLVFACGYSISNAFNWSRLWDIQHHGDLLALSNPPPDPFFNELEFEREAQEAVRMLAEYRHQHEARHNRANRAAGVPNGDESQTPKTQDRD
jgi:hypothetical protein